MDLLHQHHQIPLSADLKRRECRRVAKKQIFLGLFANWINEWPGSNVSHFGVSITADDVVSS